MEMHWKDSTRAPAELGLATGGGWCCDGGRMLSRNSCGARAASGWAKGQGGFEERLRVGEIELSPQGFLERA